MALPEHRFSQAQQISHFQEVGEWNNQLGCAKLLKVVFQLGAIRDFKG